MNDLLLKEEKSKLNYNNVDVNRYEIRQVFSQLDTKEALIQPLSIRQ